MTHCFFGPLFISRRSDHRFDRSFGRRECSFGINYFAILTVLCLLASQVALSQEPETAATTNSPAEAESGVIQNSPRRQPVESEIAESGMVSYGNYRIFGAAARCNIWAAGVEYDRNSWGHFVKAQIDYVVEALPFVLLSEPTKADFWGNPKSPYQQLVPGVGFSPFGFRFLWRSNAKVKPFMTGKAGGIFFPKKILSPASSYANFNFQGAFGLEIRMTDRVELRLTPVEYFHVSNGYLAASNPGFDQLGTTFGLSYHLGRRGER